MSSKRKDPNEDSKGKGKVSAYGMFVQRCHDEYQKLYSGIRLEGQGADSYEEMIKSKWDTFSPNDKRPYEELSERDKIPVNSENPPAKREKKVKDPHEGSNALGNLNAFSAFVQECHDEFRRQNPDREIGLEDLSNMVKKRWDKLSPDDKQSYEELAKRNKITENVEHPPAKREKKVKDPHAPKPYMTAFFWFSNDERPKVKLVNPQAGVGDIAKVLGRMWGELDPVRKKKYENMAGRDRARYNQEMEAYKAKSSVRGTRTIENCSAIEWEVITID